MAKSLDCGLEVSKFEILSRYSNYFQAKTPPGGKGIEHPPPAMGLIVPYQDGFDIR